MKETKEKTQELREFEFKRLQLILGFALIIFMIIVHTTVKEIPVWVMAIPGFLMGFDPRDWVKMGPLSKKD